ncbi:MAG: galactokinase [Pseudomonadales bacterium]|nr:galactokinase [Pseudomonadales bacterium]
MTENSLKAQFRTVFDRAPSWRVNAPSRINLIGEHIDYCGGRVLPMAIQGGTTVVSAENDSDMIRVYTERFSDRVSLKIRPDHSPGFYGDWRDYVAGVVSCLSRSESRVVGHDLHVTQSAGTAGLSTSASFCLALAKSLSPKSSEVELARICQQVEHEFARVQCGIMDQMSIALGGVIYLDCQALRWQVASSDLDDVVVVVMDTGKARTLAGSAYNERVSELHQVAQSFGAENIDNLVSAPATDFLPPHLAKRFRHVTTEHRRVAQAFEAIQSRDWSTLGQLMTASHESLRDDYEVSCRELDCMVELALKQDGVLGARMTGGGFGGCAIALAERLSVSQWMPVVAAAYQQQTGIVPDLFEAEPAPGLSRQSC